jgi:hypothetical protein
MINFKLLNSVLSELAAQGNRTRKTYESVEGITSRSRHFFGVVFCRL